jgi:hypothetical protein
VNPRYRIYAAVGLGGAILLLGAFMVLGRGGSSSSAAPVIKPLHPVNKAKKAAAKKVTAKKATVKKARKAVAKTPLAPPKAAKVAKTDPTKDGMPAGLSRALRTHSVVVVSLVVPGANVDQLAYQEAKAGAAKAGAGFVRISAGNNDDVEALSTLIGANSQPANRLLDAPAVLVFRRPQELYVRINGYIDADTVAQAAENAAPVAKVVSGSTTLDSAWVKGANTLCTKLQLELVSKSLPTNPTDMLSYLQSFIDTARTEIDKIRALKPPAGKAARVKTMLAYYDRAFTDATALIAAIKRHDVATFQRLSAQVKNEGTVADGIAAELGATACASGNG